MSLEFDRDEKRRQEIELEEAVDKVVDFIEKSIKEGVGYASEEFSIRGMFDEDEFDKVIRYSFGSPQEVDEEEVEEEIRNKYTGHEVKDIAEIYRYEYENPNCIGEDCEPYYVTVTISYLLIDDKIVVNPSFTVEVQ